MVKPQDPWSVQPLELTKKPLFQRDLPGISPLAPVLLLPSLPALSTQRSLSIEGHDSADVGILKQDVGGCQPPSLKTTTSDTPAFLSRLVAVWRRLWNDKALDSPHAQPATLWAGMRQAFRVFEQGRVVAGNEKD